MTLLDYISTGRIISFQQIEPQIICMYIPELEIDCLIDFNFKTIQTNDYEDNTQIFKISPDIEEFLKLKYL